MKIIKPSFSNAKYLEQINISLIVKIDLRNCSALMVMQINCRVFCISASHVVKDLHRYAFCFNPFQNGSIRLHSVEEDGRKIGPPTHIF